MARDGGVSCLRRSDMMSVGIESSLLDLDKVHVLAVDDSLVDRIVIERLLRITSCKVTVVDSGWRALQFLGLDNEKASAEFGRLKVDLIITDYCMPRIDRCLEEGAEDFLLKPVKLADVKRLRNYLTRDVKLPSRNKRKLPEEDSKPLQPLLLHTLTISPDSPPSLTLSPESSGSSPPLSPKEIFTSPLEVDQDEDEDDNLIKSSSDSTPLTFFYYSINYLCRCV